MKVCITIDLDDYRDYHSLVAAPIDGSAPSFYPDAIPRWLDLFDRFGVRATFFMIGRDAASSEIRRVVREMVARGHEIGNHTYTHPYNLRSFSREQKVAEVEQGEAAIADVIGERPVGFRTPSCDVDSELLEILSERNYLYDSSVFPTPIMWAFMIYGRFFMKNESYQLGQLTTPFSPILPYRPSSKALHRRAAPDDTAAPDLLEIPFSCIPGVRIPFYSTLLRRLGHRFFSGMMRTYGTRKELLHALFHQIEFADFENTDLGAAFENIPGLAVPFVARERFLTHAVESLSSAGACVTLRDFATDHLERRAAAAAA